jgi:hypothetical protein
VINHTFHIDCKLPITQRKREETPIKFLLKIDQLFTLL